MEPLSESLVTSSARWSSKTGGSCTTLGKMWPGRAGQQDHLVHEPTAAAAGALRPGGRHDHGLHVPPAPCRGRTAVSCASALPLPAGLMPRRGHAGGPRQRQPRARPRPRRGGLCPGDPAMREQHHPPRVHRADDRARVAFPRRERKVQARPGGHLRTPVLDPFPVTADRFLVSFKANPADHRQNTPNAYALWPSARRFAPYVHGDPALSCWHPLPVRARTTPPVNQPQTNPPRRGETRPSASSSMSTPAWTAVARARSSGCASRGGAPLLGHGPAAGPQPQQHRMEGRPVAPGAVGASCPWRPTAPPTSACPPTGTLFPGPG